MNTKLSIAQATMKRLRSRPSVQRVVSLRLTMSETEGLIDLIDSIGDEIKTAEDVALKQRLSMAKAKAIQRGCYSPL